MKGTATRITLALLLTAVLLIMACAKPPSPAASPAPASPKTTGAPVPTAKPPPAAGGALPQQFIFLSSGKGKVYDLSAFYSEMITKYTPMKGSIEMTAGAGAILPMIAKGEAQATGYSAPATKPPAVQGKFLVNTMFAGAGLNSSTVIGLFTKPNSGIKSIKDIKGKKVYVDKPANIWPAPVFDALLKYNGMKREDFTYLKWENAEDCFKALKEGRVDAFWYLSGSGTIDMAQTTGLYIVPLSPGEQQAIVDLGTGWLPIVWKKGAFGSPEDTPTVGTPILFVTSPKVPENVIYTAVKIMFDNLKEFQSSQKAGEGFTPENALVVFPFPFHAGAIKYFKEAGIWKAEHDARQKAAEEEWKKIVGG